MNGEGGVQMTGPEVMDVARDAIVTLISSRRR
jgi:hypothetical protein